MSDPTATPHEVRLPLPDGTDALLGRAHPLFLLAGPCVVESREKTLTIAGMLHEICTDLGVRLIFKASYDKANRSSMEGFRGLGMETGLAILAEVKETYGLPIVTDVHEPWQAAPAAEVADVLQVPAFLCRQTSLLEACAATGRVVNVKKGQFLAPEDMVNVVGKLEHFGCRSLCLTERGASFGYRTLVSDMRSLVILARNGYPVVFDGTHSVQQPGGLGTKSGGDRTMVPHLVRAATAVGIDGLFLECHDDPDNALSDGPNNLDITTLPGVLRDVLAIRQALGHAG